MCVSRWKAKRGRGRSRHSQTERRRSTSWLFLTPSPKNTAGVGHQKGTEILGKITYRQKETQESVSKSNQWRLGEKPALKDMELVSLAFFFVVHLCRNQCFLCICVCVCVCVYPYRLSQRPSTVTQIQFLFLRMWAETDQSSGSTVTGLNRLQHLVFSCKNSDL